MNTIGYEELLAVGGVSRELGSESGPVRRCEMGNCCTAK